MKKSHALMGGFLKSELKGTDNITELSSAVYLIYQPEALPRWDAFGTKSSKEHFDYISLNVT